MGCHLLLLPLRLLLRCYRWQELLDGLPSVDTDPVPDFRALLERLSVLAQKPAQVIASNGFSTTIAPPSPPTPRTPPPPLTPPSPPSPPPPSTMSRRAVRW